MRKIVFFIMTLMMAGSLFAYEPSKENVTVKGNKVQYEEIYTKYWTFTGTRRWTYNTKSDKFIYGKTGSFDRMWSDLLQYRERYDIYLDVAKYKDDTCSTCATIEKFKKAYENNELNSDEIAAYKALEALHGSANELKGSIEGKPTHAKTATKSYYETSANDEKTKAVNEIPFVTEENWKTITKEEWLESLKYFVNN